MRHIGGEITDKETKEYVDYGDRQISLDIQRVFDMINRDVKNLQKDVKELKKKD